MEYTVVQLPKRYIVGLAIKTNNERAMQDIPELCERFQDGWQEKITNAVNDDIVCSYMEYEGDHTKPYTYIIGCVVDSCDIIPEGMACKELEAGKYARVDVFGHYPESLIDAWKEIWNSELDRKFTTDFEVYDQYFTEENDYKFSIHLALEESDDLEEFDEIEEIEEDEA